MDAYSFATEKSSVLLSRTDAMDHFIFAIVGVWLTSCLFETYNVPATVKWYYVIYHTYVIIIMLIFRLIFRKIQILSCSLVMEFGMPLA